MEKGTPVKIGVSTDHTVPNLKDKPWDVAKAALAREGMTMALGGVPAGPPDQEGLVAWQDPDAGAARP